MRIPDSLVKKLLEKNNKLGKDQLAELQKQVETEKKPLQELVVKNNLLSEKDLTELYAKEIEVPFVEFNPKEIPNEVLKQLPERIARQYNAVVFAVDDHDTKSLAMEDPDDIQ